ncbi:glycosyltransferase [Bacteroidetes/Chlorobi group bacterium ChocPot_Mid]|nr:MAG: glycosyltransferase [Bacteroidetes/Chlorobi group bacterium ChocPot_Mid]
MSIKLTIITATYNRGHVIKKCLDSVLAQKFKDIEHLIIDNMSSDNTQEIVEEYIKNADYKVRYIREPDKGIYNAFNKGIRLAEGEWIHFLNSDDEYYDTELLFNIFSEDVDSYDLLACGILKDTNNQSILYEPRFDESTNNYLFQHPGTILKKEFLIVHDMYKDNLKITADDVFKWEYYDKSKYSIYKSILVKMSTGGISSKITFSYLMERAKVYYLYRKISFWEKSKIIVPEVLYFFFCKIIDRLNKFKLFRVYYPILRKKIKKIK